MNRRLKAWNAVQIEKLGVGSIKNLQKSLRKYFGLKDSSIILLNTMEYNVPAFHLNQ